MSQQFSLDRDLDEARSYAEGITNDVVFALVRSEASRKLQRVARHRTWQVLATMAVTPAEGTGPEHRHPCLYCDDAADSLEHVLASGIGGRFTRRDLLCTRHNGLCGERADDPLCEQFAFAVHALEVLKGDGRRGTTWHGLVAHDGTRFDVLPNFRFRMQHSVDRPDGGFRITATDPGVFAKLEKQILAIADFASDHVEVRSYDFISEISAHAPGLRGVLKAALHFVAAVATDRERARAVCRELSTTLFSDSMPANVSVVPYEVTDDGREVHRHEIVAWTEGGETLVRVKVFNIVSYLVRLPFIPVGPVVYRQNTQNGSRSLDRTLAPHLVAEASLFTPEGLRREFARRVDAVIAIGAYKSDIVDILDDATRGSAFRMALGPQARADALRAALHERFASRLDAVPPGWVAREVVTFADRRIRYISDGRLA
jgi:hypothetical protein